MLNKLRESTVHKITKEILENIEKNTPSHTIPPWQNNAMIWLIFPLFSHSALFRCFHYTLLHHQPTIHWFSSISSIAIAHRASQLRCVDRHDLIAYGDSKNWFTFGNFFLVRSIAARGTKVKSWEIQVTRQSILSLFVPNFKPLDSFIDLIQDLQWPTLNEPVLVLSCGLGLFGLYYCLYPSGHALNQVSTNLLCTLSDPTLTYSKAHVHHQEGPHKHWTLAWGIATETQ